MPIFLNLHYDGNPTMNLQALIALVYFQGVESTVVNVASDYATEPNDERARTGNNYNLYFIVRAYRFIDLFCVIANEELINNVKYINRLCCMKL